MLPTPRPRHDGTTLRASTWLESRAQAQGTGKGLGMLAVRPRQVCGDITGTTTQAPAELQKLSRAHCDLSGSFHWKDRPQNGCFRNRGTLFGGPLSGVYSLWCITKRG